MFNLRNFLAVIWLAGSISLLTAAPVFTQNTSRSQPGIYEVVHGWPVLPDNDMLDEVSAVAVDSHGNVLILTRGSRKWPDNDILDTAPIEKNTIFLIDGKTGKFLNKFGKGVFAMPHSITVDSQDNIWVSDVALHQIFKLAPDGKLLMTIGEAGKSGDDDGHFNRPSDVAVTADGSFYVSDGYGNNRVMNFDASGKFLLKWGEKGNTPGKFDLLHGIALDAAGNVYVVDRSNHRIQVFERNGKFRAEWKGEYLVSPQDIKIGRDGNAYIADNGSEKPPDHTGIVILGPDGTFIQRVGRYGNYDGQFVDFHMVAVGKDGSIYCADFEGKRVQKFVRKSR